MTPTPVLTRIEAIAQALEAWAPLRALLRDEGFPELPGLYSGQAPQGTEPPYIVIGATSEIRRDLFQRQGHEGSEDIHLVSPDVTKGGVQQMYAQVVNCLDGATLALSGHTAIRCRVAYVTDYAEPDGQARRLVCRVTVESLVG
jgi:hypothetical protein